MGDWRCTICGFVYSQIKGDPEHNVAPGTEFADVPESWVCPICGAGKDAFEAVVETKAEVIRRYSTDELTVVWQPSKCNHNGNCTRSLPEVFDTKRRPWVDINAAAAEDIRRVVEQCPTGALTWEGHRDQGR